MATGYGFENPSQSQKQSERNLLESTEYVSARGRLPVPLGVAENGNIIVRDMSTIPHMLICGVTGSGKTEFVKTLLSVLLSRKTLEEVKIVIYDTKGIDYKQFEKVPHLMMPVLSECDRVLPSLKLLKAEYDRRFELLKRSACKDIEKYNSLQEKGAKTLPELFIVFDDYASLMLNYSGEDEFMEILRNGRIVGIHLILVSSLASTNILEKELIMLIPCRVCFRLSTRAESKKILDLYGAEKLSIPGEMIYKFQHDLFKCQGSFAAPDNIEKVMKTVGRMNKSIYSLSDEISKIFSKIIVHSEGLNVDNSSRYDILISQAAETILTNSSRRATVGLLQRRFNIGFNRAAEIMDQLEELGVVSPEAGTKPRSILMTVDEWNVVSKIVGLSPISSRPVEKPSALEGVRSELKEFRNKEYSKEIILRDFAEFYIGETSICIKDNEIHYTKPIMTLKGMGYLSPTFSGLNIRGILYKRPTILSEGYMTFEFDPEINIVIDNPGLLHADKNNISEVIKVEFGYGRDRIIKMFLQQVSEDIGIPITYV